jgi:hypothetical protein
VQDPTGAEAKRIPVSETVVTGTRSKQDIRNISAAITVVGQDAAVAAVVAATRGARTTPVSCCQKPCVCLAGEANQTTRLDKHLL